MLASALEVVSHVDPDRSRNIAFQSSSVVQTKVTECDVARIPRGFPKTDADN